jgi:hypothetical protein
MLPDQFVREPLAKAFESRPRKGLATREEDILRNVRLFTVAHRSYQT